MAELINLFGKGKTATLSPKKQKAYAFKDACAQNIMINANQNGIEVADLIDPFMQFAATLVAAARMTGSTVDVEALCKQFPDEVSGMVKLIMENASKMGVPPNV